MFTLPDEAFAALQEKARREGTVPGAILRAALRRDLSVVVGPAPLPRLPTPRPAGKAVDPAYLGALRNLLARDIIEARGWSDLIRRLSLRGYRLELEQGRLALYGRDEHDCLADATGIGASYGALMRRFGGPLPPPTDRIDNGGSDSLAG
jgi:hypothetical protein